MVNCSAEVRNFYIESSLGTFISESSSQSAPSGTKASSADQISKVKSKYGRQRGRRRRRRKRSLKGEQEEEVEVGEENPLEVLFRRHAGMDGVSDSVISSSNVVTYNKSKSKATKVPGNTADKWRTKERGKEEAKAHHRDNNTNEATAANTSSCNSRSSRRSKCTDNEAEEEEEEESVVNRPTGKVKGERKDPLRTRVKRESGRNGGGKAKIGESANCRNKNVWIENFVYSPTFSVRWRFSPSDLQTNETSAVISFR